MRARPLDGLLVIDFTTLLPGPLATLMLAEAGAEVVKIEKPGGEDVRRYPPFVGGASVPFALLNRGKRSVVLDLKEAGAAKRLAPLLSRADVLVEQFRPGVMERLGLGREAVRAINPRLVYCSISGYGQTGPRAGEAGHDINYQGNTGIIALAPGPADAPKVPPTLTADIAGGSMPAVINILLALLRRERTGEGAYLDIAMTDAMFTFAVFAQGEGIATGRFPAPNGGRLTGGSPRYALYPTADGGMVAVGSLEDKFWEALCGAIDLASDLRDDGRDPAATRRGVAARIASRAAEEWRPILAAADCCATIVEPLSAALDDPHFKGRGLFDHRVGLGGGRALPATVVPIDPAFRENPGEMPIDVPPLGADTETYLGPPARG